MSENYLIVGDVNLVGNILVNNEKLDPNKLFDLLKSDFNTDDGLVKLVDGLIPLDVIPERIEVTSSSDGYVISDKINNITVDIYNKDAIDKIIDNKLDKYDTYIDLDTLYTSDSARFLITDCHVEDITRPSGITTTSYILNIEKKYINELEPNTISINFSENYATYNEFTDLYDYTHDFKFTEDDEFITIINDIMESKLSDLNDNVNDLLNRVDTLENNHQGYEQQFTNLQSQIDQYIQDEQYQNERLNLLESVINLSDENSILINKINELTTRIEELERQLSNSDSGSDEII